MHMDIKITFHALASPHRCMLSTPQACLGVESSLDSARSNKVCMTPSALFANLHSSGPLILSSALGLSAAHSGL